MKFIAPLILLIFTLLFVAFSNTNAVNPEDVRHNLTDMNDGLFNLTTETITYTNLYEEEPTVRNVVYNIMHGIIYGVVVEVNTLLPIAIETAGGTYAVTIMKFVILYIILILIFSLPRIITMILAFVFFIKEKRKGKTRFWE